MLPTKEEVEALETKHGRVAVVKSATDAKDGTPEWAVVLRKPKRTEYKAMRAQVHNPAAVADAGETLFRQICVWPDAAATIALLDEWPGIPEACSQAVLVLTGSAAQADTKA